MIGLVPAEEGRGRRAPSGARSSAHRVRSGPEARAGASEGEEHLGGAPLVHGLVALRGPVQGQGEVEDPTRIDLAVPDELDQLGQEPVYRGGAALQEDADEEQVDALDPTS